jgi:hypothetical protein
MVFAGMDGYTGMYRSPNGKENWSQMNDGLIVYHGVSSYNVNVFAIGAVGATLLTGTDEGIYYSDNNGQHWDSAGATANACSFATANQVAFAGAGVQGVLSSSDFGRTWKLINSDLNVTALTSIGKIVFAAGVGGHVSFTTNSGTSWTSIDSGLPAADVFCLAGSSDALLAGFKGKGVWRFTLAGEIPVISGKLPFDPQPRVKIIVRNSPIPRLTVFSRCAPKELFSIMIYNLKGEKMSSIFTGLSEPGNQIREFELTALPCGTYIVHVRIGTGTISKCIVVAH